ncbi:SMP-30/gluconolactonase/LRE family protein [Leptospira ellisii]|uniref:Gluconolactonase n=1 Tax=Leptospira ellisii TaxID=2023197 RepID=A0A2N0B7M5_9LEPT|nr:SMP-30/gluconolactonase/LRE family protein [Leptospira ellisii]MDV6236729.1 SMP-30/gluconolactonase/LRE family protein [Leptospira ellisii]PJZ92555.1 gluconolactonase [Leptospira ellisii]PKA05409.1 gluconolactonase [Leptospira ellisii]
MNRKRIPALLFVLFLFCTGYLAFKPSPIDPLAYDPEPPPAMTGVYAPNDLLLESEWIAPGKLQGPEDMEVDDQGNVYASCENGKVILVSAEGHVKAHAATSGRPLGSKLLPDGRLILADADKGLLEIGTKGEIKILSTEAEGVPFRFTNDLDLSKEGIVYFSDASFKYGSGEYLYDLMEARPNGRLMKYDPSAGKSEVLLNELYFANGVALSKDEDFVLVNETYRYRIRRYWLKGPNAGRNDLFMENLPGFPDNISADGNGTFYIALFTVRNSLLDDILHPRPALKNLIAKLPEIFWPKAEPYGFVLAVDESGTPIRSFQDTKGERMKAVTSAKFKDGFLYMGSLHNDRIGKFRLNP